MMVIIKIPKPKLPILLDNDIWFNKYKNTIVSKSSIEKINIRRLFFLLRNTINKKLLSSAGTIILSKVSKANPYSKKLKTKKAAIDTKVSDIIFVPEVIFFSYIFL
jgi:hypothetical protein